MIARNGDGMMKKQIRAKRTILAMVILRAKAGKCLLCDKQSYNRGVCVSHYLRFQRKKAKLSLRDRREFEDDEVRNGRILGRGQVCELRSDGFL